MAEIYVPTFTELMERAKTEPIIYIGCDCGCGFPVIKFDVSYLNMRFPNTPTWCARGPVLPESIGQHTNHAAQFAARRNGDSYPYPVSGTEQKGDLLIWRPTKADSWVPGFGELELRWFTADGGLAKSPVITTFVLPMCYDGANAWSEDEKQIGINLPGFRPVYELGERLTMRKDSNPLDWRP